MAIYLWKESVCEFEYQAKDSQKPETQWVIPVLSWYKATNFFKEIIFKLLNEYFCIVLIW